MRLGLVQNTPLEKNVTNNLASYSVGLPGLLKHPHMTNNTACVARVCINHAPAAPAASASFRNTHRHTGRIGLNIQHAPAVKTPKVR